MNGSNLNVSMYAICHEDFNEDVYEIFQYSSSTFALDRKIPDEKKEQNKIRKTMIIFCNKNHLSI